MWLALGKRIGLDIGGRYNWTGVLICGELR